MKLKHWFGRLDPIKADIAILVVLGAILWLTSCGMWDLRGPDEARYIQVGKELLSRHNWFYLTVQGRPYDQKPPLAFWLFAVMLKLDGGEINAWLVRLPSIFAALATMVLTYLMGRHSFGRRSGFIAALMLLTTPLFIKAAPVAELDMLYTAAICGCLCAWITRPATPGSMSIIRLAVFWLSLAAAFFIKGPLALLIVLSTVTWTAWRSRNLLSAKTLRSVLGIIFLAALIVGWLYLQRGIYGSTFVTRQVSGETVRRLLNGDHGEPIWYYLPRIFTGVMFPWAFLAIPALITLIKNRGKVSIDPATRPYFGWLLFPFIILCLAHGKRQTYLLPLLPAATILSGAYFSKGFAHLQVRRSTLSSWAIAVMLLGAAITLAGITIAVQPGLVQNDVVWVSISGMILLIMGGLSIIIIGWKLRTQLPFGSSIFYAAVGVILAISWVNFMVIRPSFDPSKSTRYLSKTIDLYLKNHHNGKAPDNVLVGAVDDAAEEEYHVYGKYQVKALSDADTLSLKQDNQSPDLVVMKAENKHSNEISRSLADSGYTNRRHITVSKDDMVLFEKPTTHDRSASREGFDFFFAGDTGSGKPQIYNIVKQMDRIQKSKPVDGVFLLGDNLYKGYIVSHSLQELFVKPFAPLLARNIPFYAVLGNHDYKNGRVRGEVEYPLFNMAGQRYYSLDFGTGKDSLSVFICDGQTLAEGDTKQASWLDFAVKRSHADWKILLIHEPIEASEVHHGASKKLQQVLQNTLPDLDMVFSGHNHLYERRKLVNGTLYITTGSGGQLATDRFPADNQRITGYNKLGTFLQMGLRNGEATLTAMNENGQLIDQCILTRTAGGVNTIINTLIDPTPEKSKPQFDHASGNQIAERTLKR